VDKDGNRVKDGEKGEVVYTNLGWRGSMVIRYRTGDICDGIEYAPCQYCGRTVPRLSYNIERQSEYKEFHLTKIKGELVNLNAFYSIINDFPEIMLGSLGAKDARILATYALTEAKTAWAQCHENSGYHLYPDLEFIELADKDGNRVKDGEKGEVVYTNLGWRGSMVIRYRTGDICDGIEYAPCQYCGRTVPRLSYNIERQSEYKEFHLTKIKGELVNLNAFYSIINEFPEIAEWQVKIAKVNNDPFELDEIRLNIAIKEGVNEQSMDHKIGQRLFADLSVAPKIRFYKIDELTKMLGLDSELKEKRIVDTRPKN